MKNAKRWWTVVGAVLGLVWIAAGAEARVVPGGDGSTSLTFTGRVVDANGNPVVGATVDLRPTQVGWLDPADPRESPVATVKTDWRGEYTLQVPASALPKGDFAIDATRNGQSFLSLYSAVTPADVGLPSRFFLLYPETCVADATGRCLQLESATATCADVPNSLLRPAGSKLPNICDPSWPPAQAPQPPAPNLPPDWSHLGLSPLGGDGGFGGGRNASTSWLTAKGGPFAPSGGGQTR